MSERRSKLRALQQHLAAAGVGSCALHGSHASTHETPAAEALCAHLRGFEVHAPAIRIISNLTMGWVASAQVSNVDYRAQDPLQAVRLSSSLSTLLAAGARWVSVQPSHS